MRIDKFVLSEDKKAEIIQTIETAEDKSSAIYEAMEMIAAESTADLVDQIVRESEKAKEDEAYREAQNFRTLSRNEKSFYETLKRGAKAMQAVTADQIDIIPTEIIDKTLKDVKTASGVTSLINFTPAGVKKWLFGSKTGAAGWGNLTDAITEELTATITSLPMDVFKLSAYCIIPKAIRDLEIGYVDRYFTAVLREAMQDGIAQGFLSGDGKTAPIGILKQINSTEQDGTHSAKTKINTVTSFSPKGLSVAMKTLSNGGLRSITSLAVIANPNDVYDYINPALYGDSVQGGYIQKTAYPVTVYADANIEQGTAVLTAPGLYTMGFQGVMVDEYKETKALDDADVVIAKVYANGRADDDNTAVVFDPTVLEEYLIPVKTAE